MVISLLTWGSCHGCPIDKQHLGTLTGADHGSIWGKDFSSDPIYGVRLLVPTELKRCLNVFVEIGFGPDFVYFGVFPRARTSVVS